AMGGTLVTDTTGIIAPVGTPRLLCRATNTIIVQSPGAGLLVAKQVANVTDGEVFHASPYVSDGLAGQTMQFRVQIANIGTSDLSDAVVYDLLPHAGDTGTIASQADVSRGSTQTPILTAVTPPDGWTIEYSSSANPCRPELNVTTNCDDTATWSTSLPMDQVASIRLTSPDAGVSAYSEMILTYTVPPAGQWSSGDIVFNSVGATATQGGAQLPPTEAPKVGFRYPSATLIWYKTDPSGDPLAGATFEVTGPDGFDQTVTDNVGLDADPTDGTFMLANGLTVGDYTITETAAPDGYAVNTTPLHATIDTAGATVTAGTVVDLPLLTPVTMYVQKKGEATSGDEVPMAGSTWQVLADDSGQPGDAVDTATLSPATDAQQAPITGLWQIDGLTPGVYWLAETSAPHGFSLLPAPVQFTIDGQGQVVLGANAGTGTNALVTAAAGGDDQAPWWVVTVHDVPAVVLPLTGGAGDIPWLVGGALATAGAILFMIGGYLGRAGRRPRRRVTTIRT
ncbi:MAG: SpaA isopeptide-forming pilin-related protein, partial [Micrococcales bacterium]|nr:SpaA isopeptide-forming pilin-related protein [Micrococcales bacterium]